MARLTKEQIQEKLSIKRQLIRNAPEYYGYGPPSKCGDYRRYKTFLKGIS